MSGFFKAVWNKITAVASWIKEKVFGAAETAAYFTAMSLAKAGGWIGLGTRWLIDKFQSGSRWVVDQAARLAYELLVGSLKFLRGVRWGLMAVFVFGHNLVATFGLVLQTPYLAYVDRGLLKQCWYEQVRRLFFIDGMSASVAVAEVTWAHLKERRANRIAAKREAQQHAAQQPKGRPTPKQRKNRTQRAFQQAALGAA